MNTPERVGFSRKVRLMLVASIFVALPAMAQNDKLMPIRIAATPAAVSLPQWIAMKEGIFQKHGLQPQETVYNVNFQGLLAIGSQQGDVSIQSDIPTISSLAKGIDAVIVAVMARFTGGCKLVAPKSIQSTDDLLGRRVAWPKGTGCEYGLFAISKANKFDLSRFTHVDLPPAEGIPLLIKGDLAGAFYWEPWPRIALKNGRGKLHVIANSDGFYDSLMFLTVRRSFAEQNPAAVQGLLRALDDARRVLQNDPGKGVAVFR
jgi:NitT/TauT family transport system substrate-binding protein